MNKNLPVEKIVKVFRSHEEAACADRDFYARMQPAERLRTLLELVERGSSASTKGFERIYRVTPLPRS